MMFMTIIHYKLKQNKKKCCNITIKQKKVLSKPEETTVLQKYPKIPNQSKRKEKKNKRVTQQGNDDEFEKSDKKYEERYDAHKKINEQGNKN